MANKVLSIKMDEKDIERLKKYYEALIGAGFLSSGKTSLNAFYKHLLLDYLEDDLCSAFAIYAEYGISPKCINPEVLDVDDNKNCVLANIYDLDDEMFQLYKKCVKEEVVRIVHQMKENAGLFNEVCKSIVIPNEGTMYELEYISSDDINEKKISFWEGKAFETLDLQEKAYKERGEEEDIAMIKKSSASEELKQKLINEISEYEKKRKQNYNIIQGRGM